jgi:vacuolar protein-sorting-associated protein 4
MFLLSVGSTPCELTQTDYRHLAEMTEGYSGSDISIAVQDALMQPIRKIQTATHYVQVLVDGVEKLTPCSPGVPGAIEMSWADIESERLLEPPLLLKDFSRAIHNSRPTVSQDDLKKNEEWTTEFGFEGA